MDTHKNRKDAARKALKRAIDDGCLYEDIASATDIDSVSLRGFASHGKLGPDKTIALLGHLTEQGYMKEPQTNLRLLPSVDQPDPGLILAKQFSILADIWASGFFDAEYKAFKFKEFVTNSRRDFEAYMVAIEKLEKRP